MEALNSSFVAAHTVLLRGTSVCRSHVGVCWICRGVWPDVGGVLDL